MQMRSIALNKHRNKSESLELVSERQALGDGNTNANFIRDKKR